MAECRDRHKIWLLWHPFFFWYSSLAHISFLYRHWLSSNSLENKGKDVRAIAESHKYLKVGTEEPFFGVNPISVVSNRSSVVRFFMWEFVK